MTRPYNISIKGEALRCLIMNGFINGNEYLFEAVGRADIDLCRWLLESGFESNFLNYEGSNILHLGARSYNLELMKLLFKYNGDINKQNNYGNTPLHQIKNMDMVKFLIEHGADPNIRNYKGKNAREEIIDYINLVPYVCEYTDQLQELVDYLQVCETLPTIKEPEEV